jgi:membrane-associated protease RseP (regulator of RpoE activity)
MSTTDLRPPSAPASRSYPPADGYPETVKSPRRVAAELAAVVAVIVGVSVVTGALDLLIVILCLIVMVMVHEAGHLLAAKRGGMKVTEYFLGFGPRLWSFRRGETEYGIKALPLGGYVKIPGMTNLEEVDPADEARTYRQQPFHARLLVAVAGSAMHFLMAALLLFALLAFVGVPNGNQISIQKVGPLGTQPGPAQLAGIRAGDVVVSVDGKPVGGNADLLTSTIRAHPGQPVTVVVERSGSRRSLTVTPANGRVVHEPGVVDPKGSAPFGIVGVTLGSPTQRATPLHALASTGSGLVHVTWASILGVGHLFSPGSIAQRFDQVSSAQAANQAAANGNRVTSIYGAGRVAVQAARAGLGDLLVILISINIFVGIFNLFPMLPLDGGHVAIALYEKFRTGRRKALYHADVSRLMPFTYLMLLFLGVLFATSLLTDILHPMANPFG